MNHHHVLIVGAGAYGNALKACILTTPNCQVTILNRQDCKTFSENILKYDFILIAVPSQSLREIALWIKEKIQLNSSENSANKKIKIISTSKGIEKVTTLLPHQIIEDVFAHEVEHNHVAYAVLSGPSFAKEMSLGLPTSVVLASKNKTFLKEASVILHSPYFRIYSSHDVMGVEIGGALKNVIAMVAGGVDGLNLGNNARAAVITRGLNEMAEIGVKMGANPLTFMGLSGLGDLILTATGDLSRNRQFGTRLAQGEDKNAIISSLGGVVEGIGTTQSVYELCQKLKIETRILMAAYKILYENFSIKKALETLLNRVQSPEFDWIGPSHEPSS